MASIYVEAQLNGSSEAQASVIRRFNVTAVLRGTSVGSTAGKPRPEPKPEQPKQEV